MIAINKLAAPIPSDKFWEWLLDSSKFRPIDYIDSVHGRISVADAIKTLKSFKADLKKAGLIYDL